MADSPVSALELDLGERFKLVDLVPAALIVTTVALLFLGSWVTDRSNGVPAWWSAGLLLGVAFVVALAIRPFQVRLVRILEGYWKPTALTSFLFDLGVQHHRGRRNDLLRLANSATNAKRRIDRERGDWAREQLRRYPVAEDRIMPTALGNALRSAEDLAGSRYGLSTTAAFPRLFGLIGDQVRAEYVSLVDQYDSGARLAVGVAITAPVCAAIAFVQLGALGLLPLTAIVFSWVFYRGAVETAALSGELLHAIVDLHRFELLEHLRVPLPATPADEVQLNQKLSEWFIAGEVQGGFPIERYDHPPRPGSG